MNFAYNCKCSERVKTEVEVLLAGAALENAEEAIRDLDQDLAVFLSWIPSPREQLQVVVSEDIKHSFQDSRVYKLRYFYLVRDGATSVLL